MRKLIAAINMTLDGFCDHTSGIADDETHAHYTELLRSGDVILYGRKTFELMEYWKSVLANPTGNKASMISRPRSMTFTRSFIPARSRALIGGIQS
jgi:dihydrofolate reductase